MAKSVGLTQESKKMLAVSPHNKELKVDSVFFYCNAKRFFMAFRKVFGQGFFTINGIDIPNLELLAPSLVLFHFSIELILKALISLQKKETIEETHDLIKLLEKSVQYYPQLSKILKNKKHKLLLAELSKKLNSIRYGEGCIMTRHNKQKGWINKKPNQELSEACDEIFNLLKNTWEEKARKEK